MKPGNFLPSAENGTSTHHRKGEISPMSIIPATTHGTSLPRTNLLCAANSAPVAPLPRSGGAFGWGVL